MLRYFGGRGYSLKWVGNGVPLRTTTLKSVTILWEPWGLDAWGKKCIFHKGVGRPLYRWCAKSFEYQNNYAVARNLTRNIDCCLKVTKGSWFERDMTACTVSYTVAHVTPFAIPIGSAPSSKQFTYKTINMRSNFKFWNQELWSILL